MTRKFLVTDDFDAKDIDPEKERSYQIDVLTNTKVGKMEYFTKGTIHLRHKNFMDLIASKGIKVPFQIWVKHSKAEIEATGDKGHWEDLPSAN